MRSSRAVNPEPPELSKDQFKLYGARWGILFLYGIIMFLQAYIFNQWSPIYASMSQVFNWNERTVAILGFYGALTFTIFVVPSSIAAERLGFRKLILLSAILVTCGCVVRCFSFITNNKVHTILIHISAFMNGIPGALQWYAPPTISARWFGPHERKVATASMIMLNSGGVAASFIIGPLIIQQPDDPGVTIASMRARYFYLTWAQTALAAILFVLVLLFFSEKPKTPPSASAEIKRIDYLAAINSLLTSKAFWISFLPFFLVVGSFYGWSPAFGIIIKNASVDEKTAGLMGFWGTVVGIVISILVAKLGDVFGHPKSILFASALLALEGSLWLVMITGHYIPFTVNSVWIAVSLINISNASFLPIIIEVAVELCYPVDEPVVIAIMGVLIQAASCVMLVIMFFPSISLIWVNWLLMIAALLALPSVLCLPEHYKRSEVDREGRISVNCENCVINEQGCGKDYGALENSSRSSTTVNTLHSGNGDIRC